MIRRPPRWFLLPLVLSAGCASWSARVAGTIPIPAAAERTLELRAPLQQQMAFEITNDGPGGVHYRCFGAGDHEFATGWLDGGGDCLSGTANGIVRVELRADEAGATPRFVVRSRGPLSTAIRQPDPPSK